MQIVETQVKDFKVMEFVGNLDTATAPQAQEKIDICIQNGDEKFIFNFAQTEYMSSSGLRVLLATSKMLKGKGELRISNLNLVIQDIFDISGFSSILNVFSTQEEALEAS